MSTVSVIIPTHNRRAMLAACLATVQEQTQRPDEILIVDDASTDDTERFIKSNQATNVHYVRLEKNSGVAVARNVGAERAVGEWLVFIDDDCLAEPDWLATLMAEINEQQPDFAWGRTDYLRAGYRGYFPERLVSNQRGKWPGAGNFVIRRDVFRASGGFDPAFLPYVNEDSEFAIRLVSQGYRYERVPTALVYHQAVEWTVRSLLATHRNASVWPILKKKYPRHWREFRPEIIGGVWWWPIELIIILTFPIAIPFLFIRYLVHGKRRIGIFFAKYPLLICWRRLGLWREAVRQRVVMI